VPLSALSASVVKIIIYYFYCKSEIMQQTKYKVYRYRWIVLLAFMLVVIIAVIVDQFGRTLER